MRIQFSHMEFKNKDDFLIFSSFLNNADMGKDFRKLF